MGTAIVFKSANTSTAEGLELLRRDPMLRGDNGGVKFLFDLAFPFSWPDQDDPVDGAVIVDVAEEADGDVQITGGQTVSFTGGGFDFSALTADPACVRAPSGCLQSIHDAAHDYFMVVGYFKLPSSGDWNTISTIAAMFCATAGPSGYPAEADLVTISQRTSGRLSARRQTAGSTVTEVTITVDNAAFGQLAQIAYYRTAAGGFLRLKTATTSQTSAQDAGDDNAGDFSLQRPQWGVPNSFNSLSTSAEHRAAAKHRLYRGWVEDLTLSARDPVAVLDADWSRVVARGEFT